MGPHVGNKVECQVGMVGATDVVVYGLVSPPNCPESPQRAAAEPEFKACLTKLTVSIW